MEERNSLRPIELFYCYARKDRDLRDELDAHLTGLRRSGLVTTWHDGEIVAGTAWEEEIETHLNTADIILLLVSPEFIRSDYCYSKEMKSALERHHAKKARVVPILLRPVDWTGTPFSQLQMIPTDALPITSWKNRDEAFADVAKHLRRVVNVLIKQRNTTSSQYFPESHKQGDAVQVQALRPLSALNTIAAPFRQTLSKMSILLRVGVSLLVVALIGTPILISSLFTNHTAPFSQKTLNLSGARSTATAAASAYTKAITLNGVSSGFDPQQTRFNPYEQLLTPTSVSRLVPFWTGSIGGAGSNDVVVTDRGVYIGTDDSEMYAFESSGCGSQFCSPLWTGSVGAGAIQLSPAVANDMAFIPLGIYLYAFKASSCGTVPCMPLWRANLEATIDSSPIVANGKVYVTAEGAANAKVYVINASGCGKSSLDPQFIRSETIPECPTLWNGATNAYIDSSPAIDNGILYVVAQDNRLYAFKASGCNNSLCPPLWTTPVVGESALTVADGVIYIGSHNGKIRAFKASNCNSSSCQLLWTASTGSIGSTNPSLLAIANGVVYVGSQNGKIYAFRASDCTQSSCPPLWTASTQGSIRSSPFVANGVVYIASTDGKIYAFKALGCGEGSCLPLWQFSIGKVVESSPMVVDGVVYIASDDHKLYTFHLPNAVA